MSVVGINSEYYAINAYSKDAEPVWLADSESSSKESTDSLASNFTSWSSLLSLCSLKSFGKKSPFLPSAIDLSIYDIAIMVNVKNDTVTETPVFGDLSFGCYSH